MTAEDLGAAGAMTVLLKDALKPNLIQTLEGQPCLMHCGPFANIAHGNSSLVADLIGLKLGEYVVTESGFGSDMGMEKFFDIVCRKGDLRPSAVVLVATVRALKHHGGVEDDPRVDRARGLAAVVEGAGEPAPPPRDRRGFGLPCVVAVNRRPGDTDEEVGARAVAGPGGRRGGGRGQRRLRARRRRRRATWRRQWRTPASSRPSSRSPTRTATRSTEDRRRSPRGLRRRATSFFYPDAERKLAQFTDDGPRRAADLHGEDAPVAVRGPGAAQRARRASRVPVRDIRAYTGAGWLVPLCGDIMQMPGLGKSPAALNVDIDADGAHGRAVLGRLGRQPLQRPAAARAGR